MVDVVPFSALRYNTDKAGPLQELTAPPYDVIRPDMQEALYDKNPYNVVRLILGRQYPDDTETNNRYTRAAADFREWRASNILMPDPQPAFYVYRQDYDYEGRRIQRAGLFARVRLEEFSTGNICPHEFTLSKAKQDRARLIRACRANFSAVFGLYSDPRHHVDAHLDEVMRSAPLGEVTDEGVENRLWRLTDPDVQESIRRHFADKKVYIADGHHRYETALAYYREHGKEVPGAAWVLMFLTNLDAEGLVIYPIHRQVKAREPLDSARFCSRLEPYFDLESLPPGLPMESLQARLAGAGKEGVAFAAWFQDGQGVMMRLKSVDAVKPFMAPEDPEELKVLGVYQLHTLVLNHLMGIDTRTPEGQQHMNYNVRAAEAREQVEAEAGQYDVVFFLNPTPMEQVRRLAERGIRLPQKATYFYPKLLSGLVINPFEP